MIVKLLFDELIELDLLNILFGQFVIFIKFLWIFVSDWVSRNIQIGQKPVVQLLVPNNLFMN